MAERAKLNGIADVVGSIARYEPFPLNIEYTALSSATRELVRGVPTLRIQHLRNRGIVSIRRAGDSYSVEITPRGEHAKILFEAKPSL